MKTDALNILVADDDEAIRFVVSASLRRVGHTVEIVNNGKEAIRSFDLKPNFFDVLITDHDMPEMSGIELVHHLCQNEVQTKIVVISGSLTDELIGEYKTKRVDKILQKPFMLENLSSTLNDLFEQWR